MKLTVIETFQDAITKQHYQPGEVINITDSKRADAMISKKLVEVAEQPKATRKASRKLEID